MPQPIKLKDIVDEMEIRTDFQSSYLNKKTGEIVAMAKEHLSLAEDEADISHYPAWEQEAIQVAIDFLNSEEDYILLPGKFDINEYRIMEDFCLSLEDEPLRDKMYRSIKGKGAFRRFKDNIFEHGIEQKWYQYRTEEFKRIAMDWCEENNLPYIQD